MGPKPKPITWTKDGECMICTSHTPKSNYPMGRHSKTIARHILLKRHGEQNMTGMVSRHTCDHKRCINPNHIVIGTQTDNNRDAWARGHRRPAGACAPLRSGESRHWYKLTEADVVEIRLLLSTSLPMAVIAEHFGISRNALYRIEHGMAWKHVHNVTQ